MLCSSTRLIEKLANEYSHMPLRDAQFLISNDVAGLLAVCGSRRVCKVCAACKSCSFSRNYISFQQHQETLQIDSLIHFDESAKRFCMEYAFQSADKYGFSVYDMDCQDKSAQVRFLSLERQLLRKFGQETVDSANREVQQRREKGEYCTEEEMIAKYPQFKSWPRFIHSLTYALRENKPDHGLRCCLNPATKQKRFRDKSFNCMLLQGENLNCSLLSTVMRVRGSPVFAQSDINRFYNQILLGGKSAAMTGFYFREGGMGSKGKLQLLFANSLQFGIRPAGNCSALCLNRAIQAHCKHPGLTSLQDFLAYIDDLFVLSDSIPGLYGKIEEVFDALKECGFTLKQFNLPFCAVNVEHPLFQRLVDKGILFDSIVMEMHKIFLEVGRSPNPKEYMTGALNMEKFPVIPPKGCDPQRGGDCLIITPRPWTIWTIRNQVTKFLDCK